MNQQVMRDEYDFPDHSWLGLSGILINVSVTCVGGEWYVGCGEGREPHQNWRDDVSYA